MPGSLLARRGLSLPPQGDTSPGKLYHGPNRRFSRLPRGRL